MVSHTTLTFTLVRDASHSVSSLQPDVQTCDKQPPASAQRRQTTPGHAAAPPGEAPPEYVSANGPCARPAEAATLKGRPRRTGYPARTGAWGPLFSTLAAWGRHGAQPDRPPPRSEQARRAGGLSHPPENMPFAESSRCAAGRGVRSRRPCIRATNSTARGTSDAAPIASATE
jgi:hypothetical protein